VTAKNSAGKEIFKASKIYMPIPQQLGRGDKMGRGPYEKSGILRDSSLPPNRPVKENFEIPYPAGEFDMTVDVELWYLPFGTKSDPDNAFLWQKVTKKASIDKGGV
jgi:hypothetical protein